MNTREDVPSKDVEALRLEMQQLRGDFASMARTLKEVAGDVGNDAYARMRESAEKARLRAEQTAETVTHSIEDRPFTSVLISFAIGLLMGLVFGRQR